MSWTNEVEPSSNLTEGNELVESRENVIPLFPLCAPEFIIQVGKLDEVSHVVGLPTRVKVVVEEDEGDDVWNC